MLGERKPSAQGWQHPGKYDLCELFSPPRVSAAASARGLRGGWALDVDFIDPVTGSAWDLSEPRTQEKVWKMIRRDKPLVIGLSPECTLFSALQNLRKTDIPADDMAKAMACVRCCVDVAEFQISKERFFYFEHPLTASSWSMPELDKLRSRIEVEDVVLHMCSFGLTATDGDGEGLVKKPTRILTNMPSIASGLHQRCSGDHRHVHLLSGKAKAAAKYTDQFCGAIVQGIQVHIEYAGQVAEYGVFAVECGDLGNVEEEEVYIPFAFDESGWCQDDVRGGSLPMDLVREGRRTEIEGFAARRVYVLRPRYEAKSKGARVVGVRWVDTQKGDKVRCRLVCQDFNTDKGRNDEMFAATPPLLASRWLVSLVASQGSYGLGPTRLMALDFSKAFFIWKYETRSLHRASERGRAQGRRRLRGPATEEHVRAEGRTSDLAGRR